MTLLNQGEATVRETVKRLSRAAQRRLHGAAIDAGILPYRPVELVDAAQWEAQHAAGDWDRLSSLRELARYSLIAGYVRHLGPARSILDLGCGEGLLVERLARSDFGRYVGVDLAPSAIGRARRLEDQGAVKFAVGEMPPPGSGRFHFVVANEVLYYLPEPAVTLERISGLVEPDGYLLTSIWRHRGDSALHRLIERRFDPVDTVQIATCASRGSTRSRVSCWRPRPSSAGDP